jgi:NAD(P)-dependent dehydrogenase (short-subunit alcohol dehydrogenase family)
MLLEDRVAIVSGIGPGMGRDIALAFAREGASLVIAARTPEKVESVAKEVEALGRVCLPVPADVTRAEDCARLAEVAVREFGGIDVLVSNAFHGGNFTRFEDSQVDAYLTPFKVNALGSLRLAQAVLPAMKARGGGSIVMISSMIIRDVLSGQSTYAASKGALLLAARGLARELGAYGIRVNSVVPGYIWGPNLQVGFKLEAQQRGVDPQVLYDEVSQKIALGRIPTSAEIADAVLFFASDLSRIVTGQSLDVNGGHAMV